MAIVYGTTITCPTIVGTHSGFVAQIKTGDLPTLMLNGANQIDNGGGNLQVYTDDSLTTRLGVDIVECVTGGTPSFLAYVRMPSGATGQTLYLGADDTQTVQPLPSATYGSEEVWQDTEVRAHLNEAANTTSEGYKNANGGTGGTGVSMSLANVATPYGDDVANFDNSPDQITFPVSAMPTEITTSFWCKVNSLAEDQRAISFFFPAGINTNEQQTGVIWMDAGGSADGWAAVKYNGSGGVEAIGTNNGDATTGWQYITATITQTSVSIYVDGSLTASGTTLTSSNIDDTTQIIIGRIWDLTGSSAYLNGALGGVSVFSTSKSADYISTEYDNQSSSTWFSNDGWNAVGGGINVTVTTSTSNYTANQFTVDLTGAISVTPTTVSTNYTANNFNVNLSGEISVTPQTVTSNYSANNFSVALNAGINVTPSTVGISYNANPFNITLSGTINITPETTSATYSANNFTVSLSQVVYNGKRVRRVNAINKRVRINAVNRIKRVN